MTEKIDMTENLKKLKTAIAEADAVMIGAGAGLSTSAGLVYDGKRFHEYFRDFEEAYGFHDMYAGGFYHYPSVEAYWAYWSKFVFVNRYCDPPKPVYEALYELVKDKEYFVITTNVDHCFQKAGFEKERLFYTQGDYGLFQCSVPCHNKTYENEEVIRRMVAEQWNLKVPTALVPRCPRCGRYMAMNLRSDGKFVEDEGWHEAMGRYQAFIQKYKDSKFLLLELGVGWNTPVIIKYPFWRLTAQNEKAIYACINYGEPDCSEEIKKQSILINGDIGTALEELIKSEKGTKSASRRAKR